MLKVVITAVKEFGQNILATLKEYNNFVSGVGKINHSEIRRQIHKRSRK